MNLRLETKICKFKFSFFSCIFLRINTSIFTLQQTEQIVVITLSNEMYERTDPNKQVFFLKYFNINSLNVT